MTTQPSNPFSFWVSGSNKEEFTYEPGQVPFYVCLRGEHRLIINSVIFADCKEDVVKVLGQAVQFRNKCRDQYQLSGCGTHSSGRHIDELEQFLKGDKESLTLTIETINKGRALKVAWADNDNYS